MSTVGDESPASNSSAGVSASELERFRQSRELDGQLAAAVADARLTVPECSLSSLDGRSSTAPESGSTRTAERQTELESRRLRRNGDVEMAIRRLSQRLNDQRANIP